jgi:predicted ABC-type ATPase
MGQEETITRRYYAGIKNLLKVYLPLADTAIVMDGSSEKTKMIANKSRDGLLNIFNPTIWQQLELITDEG